MVASRTVGADVSIFELVPRRSILEPSKRRLQRILESLPESKWRDPQILDHFEESRILHTLLATSVADGKLYYYEEDDGEFCVLNL